MKKVYLIATIMAILTAIAMYFFASTLQENSKKSNVQTRQVVVAAVDIEENTLITEKMVTVKEITYNSVTDGAALRLSDVLNKVSKQKILEGEQILIKKLTQAENEKAGELALMLPNGYRAITISVDDLTGISGYINKGDYVDLVITTSKDNKPVTGMLVENIKVLKLGPYELDKEGDVNTYKTMTLCASVTDALKIAQAQGTSRQIRVLLRSTLDKQPTGQPLLNVDINK